MQRRKLAVDLKARTSFDYRTTIQQIEEDIIVIEAGLAQLDGRGDDLSRRPGST
ncbi:hypothetical protein [Bradyrhizobium zhanjiangense]